MATLASLKLGTASRPCIASRPRRTLHVSVKAFTDNGKQSIDDINHLIGQRIKEAAARMGTMRVWQANASVGRYVRRAAEEAAAGKLKPKGAKVAQR